MVTNAPKPEPVSEVRRFTNPRATWLAAGILTLGAYTVSLIVLGIVGKHDYWLMINSVVPLPWMFRMWLARQNRTEIRADTISLYMGRRRRDVALSDIHKVTSSPYGPVSVHTVTGQSFVLPSVPPEAAPEVRRLLTQGEP